MVSQDKIKNSEALLVTALGQNANPNRTLFPAQDSSLYTKPDDELDRWASDSNSEQYKQNYEDYLQNMFEMLSKAFGIPVPEPDRWASDQTSEQYKENYELYVNDIMDMFSRIFGVDKTTEVTEEKPQDQTREEVTIWQHILDALKSYTSTIASSQQAWMQRLLSPQSTPQSRLLPQQSTPYIPMSGNINTGPISGNLRDTAISQANMAIPASQQKLNMNITSNVNLRLDGRVVANVVKRYLGESLLRYSSTGGSISRSVIV